MLADAKELGDDVSDWDSNFKEDIHGVILVTANDDVVLDRALRHVKEVFHVGHNHSAIEEVTSLVGKTRPKAQDGHEQ
jgi:hypothetical protein